MQVSFAANLSYSLTFIVINQCRKTMQSNGQRLPPSCGIQFEKNSTW